MPVSPPSLTGLAAQAAADFLTFDGVASGTLRRLDATDGTFDDTAGVRHLRRAVRKRRVATEGGEIVVVEATFHLHQPDVAANADPLDDVKVNDHFTDADGNEWVIGEAALVTLGSRWQCECSRTAS